MINEHDIEAFKRFENPHKGSSLDQFMDEIMDDYAPDYFGKVKEFHDAFGHSFNKDFTQPDPKEFWLRWRLIAEEFKELGLEFTKADEYIVPGKAVPKEIRENILKETADLLYVVFGLCVTYNLPIGEAFNRVHRSNMSKLGINGKPVLREDGKVVKGPNYKEPNLKDLV